ncbi:MAG: thiamine pyrophosphate-binding protein [Deltaproteobacteria bacterium]|nr:thiamine pyrophosphate-binding protein [Deltaproteobacteria bacterium]
MTTEMTGGELIARMLKAEGVDTVFGIVDGSYLQLCAALRGHDVRMVSPRHESSGAHMAGAYARLTGKLGVVIASNGPGVANLLPGIAVEHTEGNRVLVVTSCRRTGIHYPNRGGTYQAFDQVGVIRNMAKWSEAVPSAERLPELMRRALAQCWQGRPGVVHLDVPEDVINGKRDTPLPWAPHQYRRMDPLSPDPEAVKRAARLLMDARLPLLHAGGGVIHAQAFEELEAVAARLHAPVTTSWSARGALPESAPLCWPMVLIKSNDEVRNAADVVLCLGSRMGETDWWGKAPHWASPADQKLIQVDVDAEVLGRTRPVDLAVQADVKVFLRQLALELDVLKASATDDRRASARLAARREEVAKLAQARDKERARLDEKLADTSAPMLTAHVGAAAQKALPADAVFVYDGGNTSVWGQFFTTLRTPNTALATHHMGHLGAGVGQALGAAVARPGKAVCCIIGDGAFGMHPQEIETAVRHGLKVVFLVVTDGQWGMVKMTQSMAFAPVTMMLKKRLAPEATINSDFREVSYDRLAMTLGAHGERVADPAELPAALERALKAERCAVIHVDVDPAKHLWAPGLLHFKEMHQEPKGR